MLFTQSDSLHVIWGVWYVLLLPRTLWLLLHNIFLRFFHVDFISLRVVHNLFLCTIPLYRYFTIFFHSSFEGQLNFSSFGCQHSCIYVCGYLFHFSRNGITGSHSECTFNFGKIISFKVIQYYIPAINLWKFMLLYILVKLLLDCQPFNFGKL